MSVNNAKERQIAQLSAIYHAICETLSSQRADANILDVYVLYDFVSCLLMKLYVDKTDTTPPVKLKYTATLYALGKHMPLDPEDMLYLFFDCDKLYYDTNAIDAAITTARCTNIQRRMLWSMILQCIAESQKIKPTTTQYVTYAHPKESPNEYV